MHRGAQGLRGVQSGKHCSTSSNKENAYICLIIYTNYHKPDPPPMKKNAECTYCMNITLISNNNEQLVSGNTENNCSDVMSR